MGVWERTLHEAQLRDRSRLEPGGDLEAGVPFPVSERRISGGRSYAPRKYPHRDGQDTEDTGREPYTFELTIPLFADVDPSHYPSIFEQLRAIVDEPDSQGELEYVDVELGPLPVKVKQWSWAETARERDGGVFTLTLEERSHDAFLVSILAAPPDSRGTGVALSRALDLTETVSEADVRAEWAAAGADLGDFELEPEDGLLWTGLTDDFFLAIEDGGLAADELAERVDRFRLRGGLVLRMDDMRTPDGWPAAQVLVRLLDSISQAAESYAVQQPTAVLWRVPEEMSAWEISLRNFGTDERASEIISLNPVANPLFYRAGAVLTLPSE